MDWHPVISVQQTPDNDLSFQHFKCTFCILGIFQKPEKFGSHTGSKWWPGDPDVKDDPNDPLTRWPSDPVPCLMSCAETAEPIGRSLPSTLAMSGAWSWVVVWRRLSRSLTRCGWARCDHTTYQLAVSGSDWSAATSTGSYLPASDVTHTHAHADGHTRGHPRRPVSSGNQ